MGGAGWWDHGFVDGDPGIVAGAVRHWAGRVLPGDEFLAQAAVRTALAHLEEGSPAEEAFDAARRLVRSWAAHPVRHSGGGRLPAVS